jgi:hypothetical protein
LNNSQQIKTFHSRCINHLIQLAVNKFIKNENWIENFEKTMLDQIIEINKNDNLKEKMGGRGDTNYQTRWYWRNHACEYVRSNYKAYSEIFGNSSLNFTDLSFYGLLFEGSFALHRMCESNSASLPMLYSFFLQYFEYVHYITSLFI